MDIRSKRILVTGGSGFHGGHVLARLRQLGCKSIIAPRSAECNLTREPDVLRLMPCAGERVLRTLPCECVCPCDGVRGVLGAVCRVLP